jgi:hypothetical protein
MVPTVRVFAGTLALLAFIVLYIFLAMLLAAAVLPTAGPAGQFAYYAVAGLAWVPPAGFIIAWMYRKQP